MAFDLSMEPNPYKPPESKPKPPEFPQGSPLQAVLVACCVDIFGSYLLSLVIGVIYAIILTSKGLSPDEISQAFANINRLSPLFLSGAVLGGGLTVLSGYLCARIGRCTTYNPVTAYLVITVVFMTLIGLSQGATGSMAENLLLTILTILCGYYGAWLYIGRQR